MAIEAEREIGSKGDLYPPKKIREALGLKRGRKVRFRVEGRRLVVEPIPSIDDLLALEPTTTITFQEFHAHRRALSRVLEQGSRSERRSGRNPMAKIGIDTT